MKNYFENPDSVSSYDADNFNKIYTFILAKRNDKPSMEGKHYPPEVRFTAEEKIFDPKAKKERVIRYIPGENSIFKDEQSSDEKMPKTIERVAFTEGFKFVEGKETLLLEYMMLSNFNGSNPFRTKSAQIMFNLYQPEKLFSKAIDNDRLKAKAVSWCYESKWSEVRPYAKVLGINTDRDPSEVRWALKVLAERNPEKFLAGLDSNALKTKSNVLEAVERGILKYDKTSNSLRWMNGNVIAMSGIGQDVLDYFVDLIGVDRNAKDAYAIVLSMLNVAEATQNEVAKENGIEPAKEAAPAPRPEPSEGKKFHMTDEEIRAILEKLKTDGKVIQKTAYFYLPNGEKLPVTGYVGFISSYKENPVFRELITSLETGALQIETVENAI